MLSDPALLLPAIAAAGFACQWAAGPCGPDAIRIAAVNITALPSQRTRLFAGWFAAPAGGALSNRRGSLPFFLLFHVFKGKKMWLRDRSIYTHNESSQK